MSNLQDAFDLLLEHKEIQLSSSTKNEFESLRVMLTKKLSRYKAAMDEVGYLSAELEAASLNCNWDQASGFATFRLRPKAAKRNYQIIIPSQNHGE